MSSGYKTMLRREFQLESRRKEVVFSALLYAAVTVFLSYRVMGDGLEGKVHAGVLWLLVLFISLNSVSGNLREDMTRNHLYLSMVCRPVDYLLAKFTFNFLVAFAVGGFTMLGYALLNGKEAFSEGNVALLVVCLGVGLTGMSVFFTFVGAILSRTRSGPGLGVLLGFPVILPFIAILDAMGSAALVGVGFAEVGLQLAISLCLILILGVLGLMLFPYLWRL